MQVILLFLSAISEAGDFKSIGLHIHRLSSDPQIIKDSIINKYDYAHKHSYKYKYIILIQLIIIFIIYCINFRK